MFLELAFAAKLFLSSELPKGVPDVTTWDIVCDYAFARFVADDVSEANYDGGLSFKFVMERGVCAPVIEPMKCTYRVRFVKYSYTDTGGLIRYAYRFAVHAPYGKFVEGYWAPVSADGHFIRDLVGFRRIGTADWESESVVDAAMVRAYLAGLDRAVTRESARRHEALGR